MRDHARGWGATGALLLAVAGHGWLLLVAVATVLGITYVAAYALLHELKGRKIVGATIITPFLTIKTRLDYHNDAVDADGTCAVAEPIELKRDDGGVLTRATRKKRPAGRQSHGN